MRHLEKAVMLQELDHHWREHLAAMDYLRQGIHLRGYAQKNPKQEYKREAFELFGALLDRIKHDTSRCCRGCRCAREAEIEEQERERERQMARQLQVQHAAPQSVISSDGPAAAGRGSRGRPAASRRGAVAARAAGPRPVAGPGPQRAARRARRPQGRPQRAVSVRLGQEVQALPRPARRS